MSNIVTSLLVGSVESLAAQTVTLDGSPETLATGNYYLRESTTSRSLLDAFKALMVSAGIAGADCFLGKNKKAQLRGSGTFTVSWTSTTLRNLLGFTQGNLSGAATYEADSISKLIWSPAYRARPATILGVEGYSMPDTEITSNQEGTTSVATTHYTATLQNLDWDSVHISKVWTTAEAGGEFEAFRDEVLQPVARFYHLDSIIENDSLATEIDWASATKLGPYKTRKPIRDWYSRKIPQVDLYSSIDLPLIKVAEYA